MLITSGMKRMLLIAAVLVFIIGLPLFLFPGRTDTLFAWTVNPPLTAAFLGAAYLSACALEYSCSREAVWARARLAVPAVLVFTALTLVVTLLHIDKFHFGPDHAFITQAGTWVWLIIYAVVPVAMTVLWVQQRRQPGGDPPRRAPLPGWIRLVFNIQAGIALLLGVALFVNPTQTASLVWPWMLSALTGRAIGAWLVGLGIFAAHLAWENDWQRVESGIIAYPVFAGLELLALARYAFAQYPDSGQPVVDWGDPRVWVYLLFLVSILAVGLYGWQMARQTEK